MVFPNAIYLQIFSAISFFFKAQLFDNSDRSRISGNDVGFNAVEFPLFKKSKIPSISLSVLSLKIIFFVF